ncbi:hypothetical protein T484DRAFT_1774763 [Baffinella frigidus]|nr:hypothetical protein T484DRAFT_1774763 [Cryptophyta sp. CCMP2293]
MARCTGNTRLTLRGGGAKRADGDSAKGGKRGAEHSRKESGGGEGEVTVRLASGSNRHTAKKAARRTKAGEGAEEEGGPKAQTRKRSAPSDGSSYAGRHKQGRKTWEKDKRKTEREAAAKEQDVKGWVPGASRVKQLRVTPGKTRVVAREAREARKGREGAPGGSGGAGAAPKEGGVRKVVKRKSGLDVRMKKWENVAKAAKIPGALQTVRKAERRAKKDGIQRAKDKAASKKGKLGEHQFPWRPRKDLDKPIEIRKKTKEGNHVLVTGDPFSKNAQRLREEEQLK